MSGNLINIAMPTEKPTIWHSTYTPSSVDNDVKGVVATTKVHKQSHVNVKSPPKVQKYIAWHRLKQPTIDWNKIKQGYKCSNILEQKLVCMHLSVLNCKVLI